MVHSGGHALKDPSSGKWVGFFSYMAGRCDLGKWGVNSMIVSAVSDQPDGPYSQNPTPVVGPWSHNAMISKHPNGSYLLFRTSFAGCLHGLCCLACQLQAYHVCPRCCGPRCQTSEAESSNTRHSNHATASPTRSIPFPKPSRSHRSQPPTSPSPWPDHGVVPHASRG